eukprot:SAG31_NODE_222_length_19895_cov_34.907626_12_plen_226_part_00
MLWVLEHNSPAFRELDSLGFLLDCCFVALNGVTATGLATVDITRMSGSAQFVILLTMQLGSATMLTLCPVYIRMRSLRAVLPKMTRSRTDLLDLKRFTRVPQWLVEYNALRLCVIVVLTYQLVLHVVCCGLLYTMLMLDDEAAAIVRSGSGFPDEEVSLAWFSVFTSVSAYCNCGFALHPLSFTLLSKKPGILLVVELLVLGGNVLLVSSLLQILAILSFVEAYE